MSRKVLFIVLLLLALSVSVVQAQPEAPTTEDYAAYLASTYGITLTGEVDQEQFTAALTTLIGEVERPAEIDLEGFTGLEAVLNTLYFTNLDELAFVLPEEQVTTTLTGVQSLVTDLPAPRQQELAAALTSSLLDDAVLASADLSAPLSADLGTYLLGRALEITGNYKRFTGYVSDPDIYDNLTYTWNSFDQVFAADLQAAAVQLIREGVITGYNLKRLSSIPNFDPERTIIYGHANIDHARQLIALLRALGIDARVQLEPKTSAYLSLAEWGGSPGTTPEEQADILEDGNWITYAKEYDLTFEFFTIEDRDRFDEIIKTYAQRSDSNQTWLAGSFRVPLYSSRVQPASGYQQVYNHLVYQGQFYLQSFSLIENEATVRARFEETFPEGRHELWEDIWVNDSFFDYLGNVTS